VYRYNIIKLNRFSLILLCTLGIVLVTGLADKDPLDFGYSAGFQVQEQGQENDPSFLIIIADDLGFSDIDRLGARY
jgi:hypothetical protein